MVALTRFFSIFFISFFLLGAFPGKSCSETKDGKKIGLVLSGGGALGFAHVGVLKVLEQNNIAVDYVSGTSMGSIVGAAYASGRTVEELEEVIGTTDWDDLFDETPNRATLPYRLKTGRDNEFLGDGKIGVGSAKLAIPAGMIEGQSIMPLFRQLFRGNPIEANFDELPVPFRAVAADIETGKPYIPSSGDLAAIVRASMAVPGFFTPIEVDGHLLVDGGIVNNVPVDQVLAMGAEVVIVVDFSFELAKKEDLQNPFALSKQVLDLLLLKSAEEQLALLRPRDVHVNIDVGENTSTSFSSAKDLLARGEKSTNTMLKDLKRLATTPEKFAEFSAQRTQEKYTPGVIKKVTILNDSGVSDKTIKHILAVKEGEVYDEAETSKAARKVYDVGTFKSVRHEFEDNQGQGELIVDAQQKDWFNEYIRFGMRIEDDFDGSSFYQLAIAYRNNKVSNNGYVEAIAELGKNPGFSLEYYQHFSETTGIFFSPKLTLNRDDLLIRDGNNIIAEYKRTDAVADLRIGSALWRLGETSLGIARGFGEISREIGDPSLDERSYDIGNLFYELKLDTLDQRDFSKTGFLLTTRYTLSLDELGGNPYNGFVGEFEKPFTWGRNTISFDEKFAYAFDGLPTEYTYTLGGFFDVSGFKQDELLASDFSISRLAYYRRFAEAGSGFLGLGFYAGTSFEFSYLNFNSQSLTTPSNIYSGSVFLGVDTPLIPVYFAYGANSEDEHAFYFLLGKL